MVDSATVVASGAEGSPQATRVNRKAVTRILLAVSGILKSNDILDLLLGFGFLYGYFGSGDR